MGCIETGELIDDETYRRLSDTEKQRFVPIPKILQEEAKRKLDGRSRTVVAKADSGRLAKWFADQRKAEQRARRTKKSRRKMAKANRKINRRAP